MPLRDTFGFPFLTLELIADEGKRTRAYADTKGLLTIGIGHNISARPLTPLEVALFKTGTIPTDRDITDQEIMLLFQTDVGIAIDVLDGHAAWFRNLPQPQQRVMINLEFNMGWGKLALFRKFLAAMEVSDWTAAGDELKDSNWYKQVGLRGPRMIGRLSGAVA